jgi:hypothetical protein
MRRILVTRLFCLQIAPFLTAALFTRFYPHHVTWALLVAGFISVVAVALSIRDGAVLTRGGHVCNRSGNSLGFWFWIIFQLSLIFLVVVFAGHALFT